MENKTINITIDDETVEATILTVLGDTSGQHWYICYYNMRVYHVYALTNKIVKTISLW